tara:strand:+ start:7189 stop:7608 length:420 start_codon:yes stop_codon:yes gene_type:complete
MKYIKLFESFDNMSGNFYKLFGTLVYIDNIDSFGSELRVTMLDEDGKESEYVGDRKEISDDFDDTSDRFEIKKPVLKDKVTKKKPKSKNHTYDIVYYEGDRKMQTLKTNLEKKLAYGLRGMFTKNPLYKRGNVKVEVNK